MSAVLQPTSDSALNQQQHMSGAKRPVSPGPSLLKRPPPQGGDGAPASGGPLGGKPQRNMLSTPAQEFQPRGEEHGRFLNSMY